MVVRRGVGSKVLRKAFSFHGNDLAVQANYYVGLDEAVLTVRLIVIEPRHVEGDLLGLVSRMLDDESPSIEAIRPRAET
jgi:hypothetical protein